MALIRRMLKDCTTIRNYDAECSRKRKETNVKIKEIMEKRKKHMREDLTKIPTHQSQKLLTKADVKKLYPQFTDESVDFYLKVLT